MKRKHGAGQAAQRKPSMFVLGVVRCVALRRGRTLDEILDDDRRREVVLVRWEAMATAKRATGASLPVIGATMLRDHTTVLHGIRKHHERMARANGAT